MEISCSFLLARSVQWGSVRINEDAHDDPNLLSRKKKKEKKESNFTQVFALARCNAVYLSSSISLTSLLGPRRADGALRVDLGSRNLPRLFSESARAFNPFPSSSSEPIGRTRRVPAPGPPRAPAVVRDRFMSREWPPCC